VYPLEPETAPRRYTLETRPPPGECPRRFCFLFAKDGDLVAPGLQATVETALASAVPVQGDHCRWTLGRCSRLGFGDKHDFYEPNEPELERAGLPIAYFAHDG